MKQLFYTLFHPDTIKVWIVNLAAIGALSLPDLELLLKILAAGAALGYTLWKWFTEWVERRRKFNRRK